MLRDILGQHATDDLLSQLNELYEQIKILGWKEVRPWNDFFATFKAPQYNIKHLEQRITTNFLFYRSNYVVLCGAILCIQIIRAPVVCLTLVLIVAMCAYLLIVSKGPVRVGEIEINDTAKRIICAVVSVFLLAVTRTLELLIWSALYCVVACGLHMVFRPRNVTSKTNRVYEEAKLATNNYFGSDDMSGKSSSSKRSVFSGFENRFGPSTANANIDPENPPYADSTPEGVSSRSATAAYFPLSSAAAKSGTLPESSMNYGGISGKGFDGSNKMRPASQKPFPTPSFNSSKND